MSKTVGHFKNPKTPSAGHSPNRAPSIEQVRNASSSGVAPKCFSLDQKRSQAHECPASEVGNKCSSEKGHSNSPQPNTHLRVVFQTIDERDSEELLSVRELFNKLSRTHQSTVLAACYTRRCNSPHFKQTSKPEFGSSANRTPVGFLSPATFKIRAATYTRITSPGCATPSGFLSLLTFYSALILSTLFHAETVHGVETLRGFPLPVAATAFAAHCPSSPHDGRPRSIIGSKD